MNNKIKTNDDLLKEIESLKTINKRLRIEVYSQEKSLYDLKDRVKFQETQITNMTSILNSVSQLLNIRIEKEKVNK
jgi:hypothetical protein